MKLLWIVTGVVAPSESDRLQLGVDLISVLTVFSNKDQFETDEFDLGETCDQWRVI